MLTQTDLKPRYGFSSLSPPERGNARLTQKGNTDRCRFKARELMHWENQLTSSQVTATGNVNQPQPPDF